MRENNIHFEPDQFGCDLGKALAASFSPANLDRDVASVDPTEFAQPRHKRGKQFGRPPTAWWRP